jgi:hypothetical protein
MGFWEDVGCMKPLTLCGTEDGYAPTQSREAAFKGKGSFLHMDRASLDMVRVYLLLCRAMWDMSLNYIIMDI